MLPRAMAAVTQKWTFSRLKGSSAVHVGLEEQSQKRSWYMKCVQTGHLASMIQDVPFKTRHLTQAPATAFKAVGLGVKGILSDSSYFF